MTTVPRLAGNRPTTMPYAPFLKRFLAFLMDEVLAVLLAGGTYLVIGALAATLGFSSLRGRSGTAGTGAAFLLVFGGLLAFAVYISYFVKQETGPRQATLGKAFFVVRITTASGEPISVGQSLLRLILKSTVSFLLFALGFLMAAVTERKQALHDTVAGTVVVQG